VARYWPEFGSQSSGTITVAMVWGHRSCVIARRTPFTGRPGLLGPFAGTSCRRSVVVALQPRRAIPMGDVRLHPILGEGVRRVTDSPSSSTLRTEIAEPLHRRVTSDLPTAYHFFSEMVEQAAHPRWLAAGERQGGHPSL